MNKYIKTSFKFINSDQCTEAERNQAPCDKSKGYCKFQMPCSRLSKCAQLKSAFLVNDTNA